MPGRRANFLTGSEEFAVKSIGIPGDRGGPAGGSVNSPARAQARYRKVGVSSATAMKHRGEQPARRGPRPTRRGNMRLYIGLDLGSKSQSGAVAVDDVGGAVYTGEVQIMSNGGNAV